jgi:hypothetical protein
LVLLGDFADQQDVPLIGDYLTFVSSDPAIMPVSDTGLLAARANGSVVISAARGPILAATAGTVGTPEEIEDLYLYVAGLDAYPQTLALPPGSTRQFLVTIAGEDDIAAGDSGTRYFVGNTGVLQVSEDGLLTAVGTGQTTLTIIHGPAEALVPIRVEAPQTGAVTVGAGGAIVQGADGSLRWPKPG